MKTPKTLLFALAFLSSSLSFATNYSFKESHFTMTGSYKNTDLLPTPTPAFQFVGRAMVTMDVDGVEQTTAQVTIRRTTYDCDQVDTNYDDEYICRIGSKKFLQILDDVATREGEYADSVQLLTNYFDSYNYYENVELPIGSLSQSDDSAADADYDDPQNDNSNVQLHTTTTGLKDL